MVGVGVVEKPPVNNDSVSAVATTTTRCASPTTLRPAPYRPPRRRCCWMPASLCLVCGCVADGPSPTAARCSAPSPATNPLPPPNCAFWCLLLSACPATCRLQRVVAMTFTLTYHRCCCPPRATPHTATGQPPPPLTFANLHTPTLRRAASPMASLPHANHCGGVPEFI